MLNLIGVESNRNAVGARVEVNGAAVPLVRHVGGGSSFQSASSHAIFLGIGQKDRADANVIWPSGRIQSLTGLGHGMWTIVEGIAAVEAVAHNRK